MQKVSGRKIAHETGNGGWAPGWSFPGLPDVPIFTGKLNATGHAEFYQIGFYDMTTFTQLVRVTMLLVLTSVAPGAAQVIQYLPPLPAPASAAPAGMAAHIVRVVDARPTRPALGTTQAGGRVSQQVMFREDLAQTLQAYFARYAPGPAGAAPLVLRLTRLTVEEAWWGGQLRATATLEADLYRPEPDSSYRLVGSLVKSVQQFVAGGQPAALVAHNTNMSALLLQAATVAGNAAGWATTGPTYAAARVFGPVVSPGTAFPILAAGAVWKPGFYWTLREFQLNQPSEPGPPDVEKRPYQSAGVGEDGVQHFHRNAAGKRALTTDGWGFCDGTYAYFRLGANFYPLRKQGADFVFVVPTGPSPGLRNAANALSLASLAAGYGGGAFFRPGAEHRTLYRLDLASGEVGPALGASQKVLITVPGRPTQVFVYRPRGAKGPPVRIKFADDQPAQQLAAGEYLSFSPPANQPLEVHMMPPTGPEATLPLVATTDAPVYLECRPAEKAPLRQVSKATGDAAVSRLID